MWIDLRRRGGYLVLIPLVRANKSYCYGFKQFIQLSFLKWQFILQMGRSRVYNFIVKKVNSRPLLKPAHSYFITRSNSNMLMVSKLNSVESAECRKYMK